MYLRKQEVFSPSQKPFGRIIHGLHFSPGNVFSIRYHCVINHMPPGGGGGGGDGEVRKLPELTFNIHNSFNIKSNAIKLRDFT